MTLFLQSTRPSKLGTCDSKPDFGCERDQHDFGSILTLYTPLCP